MTRSCFVTLAGLVLAPLNLKPSYFKFPKCLGLWACAHMPGSTVTFVCLCRKQRSLFPLTPLLRWGLTESIARFTGHQTPASVLYRIPVTAGILNCSILVWQALEYSCVAGISPASTHRKTCVVLTPTSQCHCFVLVFMTSF